MKTNLTDFTIHYLGKWSENLFYIDEFRDLVGGKLFDFGFDPIFRQLSDRTGFKYIHFVNEARTKVLEGQDPQEVLYYYDLVLEDRRMEEEWLGKLYGRNCKDAWS